MVSSKRVLPLFNHHNSPLEACSVGPRPHYMILEACWDGLWTLSFRLSQTHGHDSWLVCEVALSWINQLRVPDKLHIDAQTFEYKRGKNDTNGFWGWPKYIYIHNPCEVKPLQSSLAIVFCFFSCFPGHGSQLRGPWIWNLQAFKVKGCVSRIEMTWGERFLLLKCWLDFSETLKQWLPCFSELL